ncbi:MAG: hypothetical protein E7675_04905, partial [Ruminococcaceae bacterium]|nr:hypothetical protein [Oscillospiraceae bacterium]
RNGDVPEYLGDTAKASSAQYRYTFLGWELEGELVNMFEPITADVTYKARYSESIRNYTVTFDVNGKEYTYDLLYGEMPSDEGIDTHRESDAQYTYTFVSWDRQISEVTGDITYRAVYDKTVNEYKITWVVNGVETVETYPYGEMPSDEAIDKTGSADIQYTYSFMQWDTPIESVSGDKTYTAVFVKELNKYTVSWQIGDEVIKTQVEYGTLPIFDATPTKPSDEMYDYSFLKWNEEPVAVTGDATYIAEFEKTLRKYTVSFVVDGVVHADEYEYGTLPEYHGDTAKTDNFDSYFLFDGWDKEITAVTSDIVYTAVFREISKSDSKVQTELKAPESASSGEVFTVDFNACISFEDMAVSLIGVNKLTYDPTLITLMSAKVTGAPSENWEVTYSDEDGVVTMLIKDTSEETFALSGDNVNVELEFKVRDNALGGSQAVIELSSAEYVDSDLNQSFTSSSRAKVSISNTSNGFSIEDGKLYYYKDGKRVSGWFQHDGVTYYASSTTNVVINYSKKISGKYYVWNDETGLEIADGFVFDGTGYKCYEDGINVIGWRHADGSGPKVVNGISEQYSSNPEGLYYFLSTTGYMVTDATYKLGGYIREFNEDHTVKAMNGLQTNGGELYYYVDGVKQTGWHTIDGTTYYFRASDAVYGRAATKWMYIGNKVYYFYASTSATPYALKDSGKIGGIEYTYHEDGYILYNGFVNCDYANAANSNTAANIQKMNGTTRYYKNGEMQTGWQQINGNWYYFYAIGSANGSGYMCVQSRTIGGVWYEFTETGVCTNK